MTNLELVNLINHNQDVLNDLSNRLESKLNTIRYNLPKYIYDVVINSKFSIEVEFSSVTSPYLLVKAFEDGIPSQCVTSHALNILYKNGGGYMYIYDDDGGDAKMIMFDPIINAVSNIVTDIYLQAYEVLQERIKNEK